MGTFHIVNSNILHSYFEFDLSMSNFKVKGQCSRSNQLVQFAYSLMIYY